MIKELRKRKPNRLKDYDYAQNGAYFVTMCAKDREELFGSIVGAGPTRFSLLPPLHYVVRNIKSYVSKWAGHNVWQKSFHDHIIRNEEEYYRIAEYIENNPARWTDDCYYACSLPVE